MEIRTINIHYLPATINMCGHSSNPTHSLPKFTVHPWKSKKKTWEKWHKNCRGQEGVPRDLHQQGKWRQKLGVSGTASLRSLQYPPIYPKKYEKKPMLSEGKWSTNDLTLWLCQNGSFHQFFVCLPEIPEGQWWVWNIDLNFSHLLAMHGGYIFTTNTHILKHI